MKTSPLNSAMNHLAAEMLRDGVTSSSQFVSRFRQEHGDLLVEYMDYFADRFLADSGRAKLKNVHKLAELRNSPEQYFLPLGDLFEDLSIPAALPVKRGEAHVIVPTMEATIEDGDKYILALQENINACIARVTEFSRFWKDIRPVLEVHPDWDVGMALKSLRKRKSA